MEYLKAAKSSAEKAKRLIMRLNLFDSSRQVQHSRSYVYFPVVVMHAKDKKLLDELGASIVSRREGKSAGRLGYAQLLQEALAKGELAKLSRGYDQIGGIAIIEFEGSKASEKRIAKALMQSNNSIRTVLAKAGAVSGRFRTRRLRYVAGAESYIADHRENNCTFRLDVRKVYFSGRLSYERSRVLALSRNGENVVVMFAGVGPFAIEIGKAMRDSHVIAMELNRHAYNYMLENIKTNKTHNVKALLGDVKALSKMYRNFADRIIMPLPRSSMDFLDDAYKMARDNAVVHLYVFANADEPEAVHDLIRRHAKANSYKVRFLNSRVARPYSPAESELAIDYRITKKPIPRAERYE